MKANSVIKSNILKDFRRIQIWRRKDKNGEFIDDDIEKSSSDEFDSEYGKENDECNE